MGDPSALSPLGADVVSPFPIEVQLYGRILIVDDEARLRSSLSLGLRLAGYKVGEAVSGEAAFTELERDGYDLMITDLVMPDINGVNLVRRAQFRYPQLPVLVMSGYHLSRRQASMLGRNVIGFVPKPFDPEQLIAYLKSKAPPLAIAERA